jgi:hypothetical protein
VHDDAGAFVLLEEVRVVDIREQMLMAELWGIIFGEIFQSFGKEAVGQMHGRVGLQVHVFAHGLGISREKSDQQGQQNEQNGNRAGHAAR